MDMVHRKPRGWSTGALVLETLNREPHTTNIRGWALMEGAVSDCPPLVSQSNRALIVPVLLL